MNNLGLSEVIELLFCSQNEKRTSAQNWINEVPRNNFNGGIDGFLSTMKSENIQVATMAALLLKKKYLDIKENFEMISHDKMEFIVKSVQDSMVPNRPLMFLKRCCDIMVKIFSFINQKHYLINLIQTLAQNQNSNVQLTLMYLIQISCQFAFDDKLLLEYSGTLSNIFQMGLQDGQNLVRVASFKTLTIFLSSIEDESQMKKFESVLQILLQKAIELIKYDQQSGIIALESLNQLVQTHPKFIKSILGQLLMVYTEIMEAKGLLVNLRITSMYGILMLSMNHASLIRKNQFFKKRVIPAYMGMLSENQSFPIEEWAKQLNDEVISKTDISLSTEQHLTQILPELGNKFLLPLFIPHIQKALLSADTSMQHAGLVSLSIVVENCHQSFRNQFDNIMALMGPLLKTQHPRIIHDLLVTIGYMAEQFSPELQTKYGSGVLEFIILGLAHSYPKVQYRAVQSIQNFENGLKDHKDVKVIQPFLDTILSHLGNIFQNSFKNNNYLMLEAVLDTIAIVSSLNSFSKYYVSFMPGLKKIISMMGSQTSQQVMVRSKTVQTMGFLLASVKDDHELFMPDCKEIMQSLINMTSNLDKDDPIHRATFVVYQNVVECLKENFVVYSDYVFKRALEAVNRKVDFAVLDESQTDKTPKKNLNQYVKMKIDLKIDGVKNIVLNTDDLEQKLQASNLLSTMSENMGAKFAPYVQAIIPTIVQLISFKNSKAIRNNILQTAKHIIMSCQTNEQKMFVIQAVMPSISKQLSTVIRMKHHDDITNIVQVISDIMPFMSQEMVKTLPQMMMGVLGCVRNLTKEVEKIYGEKDIDEDAQQEMDEEIQEIQEVLGYVEAIMNNGKNMMEFQALKQYFPQQYEFETV